MSPWHETNLAAPEPVEVDRLEKQLDEALIKRDYYHQEVVDPAAVVELEKQITEAAARLRPSAPEEAIREAGRRVAFDRIGARLVERARFPRDPNYSEEAVRIRVRYLESEIRKLARTANSQRPQLAIQSAAEDLIVRSEGRSPRRFDGRTRPELPSEIRRNLAGVSSRLSIQVRSPQPTQLQRVTRIAADLGRLDQLREEARIIAQGRSEGLFGGDVYELENALRSVRSAREVLQGNAENIYRRPEAALEAMERFLAARGEWETADALEARPESFGELRGHKTLGLKENQERARARLFAQSTAQVLGGEAEKRSHFETALSFARSDSERLANNRRIAQALPKRETLLTELGREMEGLELSDLKPVLSVQQFEIVQQLRATEQVYLEPLRQAAKIAAAPSAPEAKAVARAVAPIFQRVPRHILRRLTPPQLQIGLAALSMSRRAVKAVASSGV